MPSPTERQVPHAGRDGLKRDGFRLRILLWILRSRSAPGTYLRLWVDHQGCIFARFDSADNASGVNAAGAYLRHKPFGLFRCDADQ